MDGKLSREELIQDVRQLNEILEIAHPDPYINGGGKIAYHRRLQELIRDIPIDGMTKEDFFYHVQPFIAKLEDAHTGFNQDELLHNKENPGGIPLYFTPVEDILYVSAVCQKEHLNLIGLKLVSVEGIPFEELIKRMKNLSGFDNLSNLLGKLGRFGILYFRDDLLKLIPEWKDKNQIKITLLASDGNKKECVFSTMKNVQYPLFQLESKISLPDSDRSLAYNFIDKSRKIAILRIDDMITYREAHELFLEIGLKEFVEAAKKEFEKNNKKNAPKEMKDVIPGLPSATELFTSLFLEMKEAETDYLMVDVRNCRGGQDYIIQFLLYFLVGFEKAVELTQQRSDVLKLSEFLNKTVEKGINLEEISYYNQVPLTINDYYFGNDKSFTFQSKKEESQFESFATAFKKMPSFYKEFQTRKFESYYLPSKIIVLCSDITHSSGFDLMINLNRIGAVNVGVPSGQSGNHFGNIRMFELSNSKIKGKVATRFFIAFPEKPLKHLTHYPDFQLTYEKLVSLTFDENAAVLYALELIEKKKI
ncbi:MAG TPA: hypothetical protein VMX55_08915 [candidate division Zixibacteria bacterium]|nr:hypothetical protein [candidate division Zixibacteria bacterium]